MLGCEDVVDLLDQPIRTYIQFLVSRPTNQQAYEPVGMTLAGLTVPTHGEETCWREGGASFPIEFECAPLRHASRTVGAVLTLRDVSQRRAAERLKDEIISVVSHELRSPLTSIRGALGLLAAGHVGQFPDKGQRMLDIAVSNTDRLMRLINDIEFKQVMRHPVRLSTRTPDADRKSASSPHRAAAS
jgi:signal transduction histidine kinase